MREVWQSGESYERYIGRWSRHVARKFVSELSIAAGSAWLDVGCGSGALTAAILALTKPERVIAFDRSTEFVAHSRQFLSDGRAMFVVGDAVRLPFADARADAVVSALVLNFISQPELALREMLRCVRSGGVVATYLWDYHEGMQAIRLFWDAAIALNPRAVELDEAKRFPLCQPAALEQLFVSAGLAEVDISAIAIPTSFRDFEDLWSPFLGGQGPAPTYTMSLAEQERIKLRERFRQMAPISADGSIHLSARAWVARGVRRN